MQRLYMQLLTEGYCLIIKESRGREIEGEDSSSFPNFSPTPEELEEALYEFGT